ncbi:MAG: GGDEF domain-containing protein [Clostridia bacterium]|nr:GGDEF domain-containing protein [Clostridia bacterium]
MKNSRSVAAVIKINKTYADDIDKRIRELKKCVKECRKSEDFLAMGAAHCLLAQAYSEVEDLHNVLINSIKAITLLKDSNEHELLAESYFALGHAYTYQGNYQTALVCDERAYGIVKRHRIKGPTRIMALNNLSVSYHVMEEPKKSIRYLNECIDLLKKEDGENYTDLLMYTINLAGCHKDLGEFDRAEEIFDSVSGQLQNVTFTPLVCDYYLRRAIVSYLKKDNKAGNGYIDSAFKIFPENLFPMPLYDDLCEVARFITGAKDRKRSERIYGIMTVYAENNPGTLEQIFANSMIANYYKDFGEYELATEYFSKCEELNKRQINEIKEAQMKLQNTIRNTETEIRRLNRKMRASEELASVEPLTGLMNRSALLRVSLEFIESAARRRQKVGAIFIDIDCFKECNDTYGHARGDEIIKEVALACRKQETKDVRFARYGGDEFFGITRGLTDDELCDIARRICRNIRNAGIPNEKNPNGGILTLSVGIVNVAITDKTDTILEIANYADKAVYHAKNAGRNAIYELLHGENGKNDGEAQYIKIEF